MKRPLASTALVLLLAALPAAAQDGVYPQSGEIRTDVRIEGCPYGPQPEIVTGPRGRALHARWQRDLCARPRVVGGGAFVVPRIDFDVPAPGAPVVLPGSSDLD